MDFIEAHPQGVGDYSGGVRATACMKNSYEPKGELGEIIDKYIKDYRAYAVQIFASLGPSDLGFGKHEDIADVITIGLCGEVTYALFAEEQSSEPFAEPILKKGESLYIPKGLWHQARFGWTPRATLSIGTKNKTLPSDVTYHGEELYHDYRGRK